MRLSVASLRRMIKGKLPVEFVHQELTSYSGLELLRRYLRQHDLPRRLRAACTTTGGDYGGGRLALLVLALLYVGPAASLRRGSRRRGSVPTTVVAPHLRARRLSGLHRRREGSRADQAVRHGRSAAHRPGDPRRSLTWPVRLLTSVPALTIKTLHPAPIRPDNPLS